MCFLIVKDGYRNPDPVLHPGAADFWSAMTSEPSFFRLNLERGMMDTKLITDNSLALVEYIIVLGLCILFYQDMCRQGCFTRRQCPHMQVMNSNDTWDSGKGFDDGFRLQVTRGSFHQHTHGIGNQMKRGIKDNKCKHERANRINDGKGGFKQQHH